jgi:hypothetical protein
MKLAMDMEWMLTFVSQTTPSAQLSLVKTDQNQLNESGITLSMEVDQIDLLYSKAKEMKYQILY